MKMKLQSIPTELRSRVARFLWDRIIEKHEGPVTWKYLLEDDYVKFLHVDGFDVLLPIDKTCHANITISRCIVANGGQTLTIFLEDSTYETGMLAGYLAVCEKVPEQDWFIAIVYHECWVSRLEAVS
jgi:hypothetical protein